jgi:hypothetical protein
LAAAARFVVERWRFVKPRGCDRWIDACIAAAMAADVANVLERKRQSVYLDASFDPLFGY